MTDDRFNLAAAAASALNLLWMPTFHQGLQMLLTLLGIIYMGMQIYYLRKKGK